MNNPDFYDTYEFLGEEQMMLGRYKNVELTCKVQTICNTALFQYISVSTTKKHYSSKNLILPKTLNFNLKNDN